MAIEHTRKVNRVNVMPCFYNEKKPTVEVYYEYTFDDTEDDQLPVVTQKQLYLEKQTVSVDEDGNETTTVTDVSGHDPLVQTICNAVWAE